MIAHSKKFGDIEVTALSDGVLATSLAVGALYARRRRRRVTVRSAARAPQVAVPYGALGEGR